MVVIRSQGGKRFAVSISPYKLLDFFECFSDCDFPFIALLKNIVDDFLHKLRIIFLGSGSVLCLDSFKSFQNSTAIFGFGVLLCNIVNCCSLFCLVVFGFTSYFFSFAVIPFVLVVIGFTLLNCFRLFVLY